jgi:hypothetical protein
VKDANDVRKRDIREATGWDTVDKSALPEVTHAAVRLGLALWSCRGMCVRSSLRHAVCASMRVCAGYASARR